MNKTRLAIDWAYWEHVTQFGIKIPDPSREQVHSILVDLQINESANASRIPFHELKRGLRQSIETQMQGRHCHDKQIYEYVNGHTLDIRSKTWLEKCVMIYREIDVGDVGFGLEPMNLKWVAENQIRKVFKRIGVNTNSTPNGRLDAQPDPHALFPARPIEAFLLSYVSGLVPSKITKSNLVSLRQRDRDAKSKLSKERKSNFSPPQS